MANGENVNNDDVDNTNAHDDKDDLCGFFLWLVL